jgi:hypothetical protein
MSGGAGFTASAEKEYVCARVRKKEKKERNDRERNVSSKAQATLNACKLYPIP